MEQRREGRKYAIKGSEPNLITVSKRTVKELRNYMRLIDIAIHNKQEFEAEIHPEALNKFQHRQLALIDTLSEMILDCLQIPKSNTRLRLFYLDCIQEHYLRKTISKKHLKEMLISWQENGIIEQAE